MNREQPTLCCQGRVTKCCFRADLRTGSFLIGAWQIPSFVLCLAKGVLLSEYWDLARLIFIAMNMVYFARWTKSDCVSTRRHFYVSLLTSLVAQILIWLADSVYDIVYSISLNRCLKGECYEWQTAYMCSDITYWAIFSLEFVLIMLQVYFVVILYQNFINLRDGLGDRMLSEALNDEQNNVFEQSLMLSAGEKKSTSRSDRACDLSLASLNASNVSTKSKLARPA